MSRERRVRLLVAGADLLRASVGVPVGVARGGEGTCVLRCIEQRDEPAGDRLGVARRVGGTANGRTGIEPSANGAVRTASQIGRLRLLSMRWAVIDTSCPDATICRLRRSRKDSMPPRAGEARRLT